MYICLQVIISLVSNKNTTDLCIYTVKSIIQYYNYHSSFVYTCILDASKAFDRINHWTMFKQLILRNIPSILICILCLILVSFSGTMYIMGKHEVLFFTTSNGVRQSGILSPKLFFVYMDDFSKLLMNSCIGCFIDNVNFVLIMCFMRTTYVLWRHAQ